MANLPPFAVALTLTNDKGGLGATYTDLTCKLIAAFRSGMSRSKDFHGAASAGVPIGVVAGELTMGQKLTTIPRYLRSGGYVFIDSGAFSEFKSGEAPDFDNVVNTYELIADCHDADPQMLGRLFVVAPDKVGDQTATLKRLGVYSRRLKALIEDGVKVIVPIQRGVMPAVQMLQSVTDILGTGAFVAGIPSNKEALSLLECESLRHHSFHILGRIQMNAEQSARITALSTHNPQANFTADANWLRSHIEIVCQMTDQHRVKQRNCNNNQRMRMPSARAAAIEQALRNEKTWGVDCTKVATWETIQLF